MDIEMKNFIKNTILFIVFLFAFKCDVYAHNLQDKIKILTEKVEMEQEFFPKGDYENVDYIKKIINHMYLIDQEVRLALIKEFDNKKVQPLINFMDKFHTNKMKKILDKQGWITISKFGQEADNQAWLLVQHASHDHFFQASCVFILSNLLDKGETNKKNYAYLYDRVALNFQHLGMKQRYGTQVIVSTKEIILLPYEGTEKELDKRRKEIGLGTIGLYLKDIRKFHRK